MALGRIFYWGWGVGGGEVGKWGSGEVGCGVWGVGCGVGVWGSGEVGKLN